MIRAGSGYEQEVTLAGVVYLNGYDHKSLKVSNNVYQENLNYLKN